MNFINKDNDVFILGKFTDESLHALFKLAAVLGAGNQVAQGKGADALVLEGHRDVVGGNPDSKPLDDGCLAHAGFTDEQRIALLAACQRLDDAGDLLGASHHRVKQTGARHLCQVLREVVKERSLTLFLSSVGRCRVHCLGNFLVGVIEVRVHFVLEVVVIDTEGRQNGGNIAGGVPQHGQNHVLRSGHRFPVITGFLVGSSADDLTNSSSVHWFDRSGGHPAFTVGSCTETGHQVVDVGMESAEHRHYHVLAVFLDRCEEEAKHQVLFIDFGGASTLGLLRGLRDGGLHGIGIRHIENSPCSLWWSSQ